MNLPMCRLPILASSTFMAAMLLQSPAFAHDTWALMKDYVLKPSSQATVMPTTLKAGSMLDVKVFFDGKPAASTVVFGTYAGFSDIPGTFAYTTSTNKEGIAQIKLIKSGAWLLMSKREQGYKDPAVCDKQALAGSMTFQVK
jgi:hypothetical protein